VGSRSFEDLLSEAEAAPIHGWDFGWLTGRASEDRPSWHFMELVAHRMRRSSSALDLQTGGGEWLSRVPIVAPFTVATEAWPPSLTSASELLSKRHVHLVAAHGDRPMLPFATRSFDLVTSRHPIQTWWSEIARVLRPGGTFLSQQVGPHTLRELTEFFLGAQTGRSTREPELARTEAEAAGFDVVDLRSEQLRVEFTDVGAIVYFLRLVIWIVPGFSVADHRERLRDLHQQILRDGRFVTHSARFLIEARKAA
jgi:SAM-dependent methyltransferase